MILVKYLVVDNMILSHFAFVDDINLLVDATLANTTITYWYSFITFDF